MNGKPVNLSCQTVLNYFTKSIDFGRNRDSLFIFFIFFFVIKMSETLGCCT